MLPYPGYSWSLTQHMGRINSRELFALLETAYQFRSRKNYRTLINEQLFSERIFTPNIREDSKKVDAWRDYQQILPELGLIYSTKCENQPRLTSIGLMYIDGLIGYSELISTQVLAYQYPNGHKTDLSKPVKKQLSDSGVEIPNHRTELDINHGIMIKPGVLILKVLLELYKNTQSTRISTDECLKFLVPTIRNNDWHEAYEKVVNYRNPKKMSLVLGYFSEPSEEYKRRIRHVQEWFHFLNQSDFVVKKSRDSISLSDMTLSQIQELEAILEFHSNPDSFWIPRSLDKRENAISWFSYFGNPRLELQWVTPDILRNKEFLENNYPAPELFDKIDDPPSSTQVSEINLKPFSREMPSFSAGGKTDKEPNINLKNILEGRKRLGDKTRQHEEIVKRLANKLTDLSFNVHEDPNSVDLLAEKNGLESIFEVKTINPRNFQPRIRLGVGQLSEYRYRRQIQTHSRPRSILVLSTKLQLSDWIRDYFNSDINMGLICSAENNFLALTDGEIEKEIQNLA